MGGTIASCHAFALGRRRPSGVPATLKPQVDERPANPHARIVLGVFWPVTRNCEFLLHPRASLRLAGQRSGLILIQARKTKGAAGVRCRLSDGRAAILGRHAT
jgi:hypothetical protein